MDIKGFLEGLDPKEVEQLMMYIVGAMKTQGFEFINTKDADSGPEKFPGEHRLIRVEQKLDNVINLFTLKEIIAPK